MSHQALQRVLVRMLHDPDWGAAVIADPARALPGLGLDDASLSWLRNVDPRALRTDPHRRGRLAQALIEEFPVAAARLVRLRSDVTALDPFFSSGRFHRMIQDRGSMAGAFGGWLGEHPDGWVRAFGAFEAGVAAVRRARRTSDQLSAFSFQLAAAEDERSPGARWVLGPHAVRVSLPEGTIDAWGAIKARLGEAPVEAVVDLRRPLPPLGAPGALEPWLIWRDAQGQPQAEGLSDGLVGWLDYATEPREEAELIAWLVEAGLDEAEAQGLWADSWPWFVPAL